MDRDHCSPILAVARCAVGLLRRSCYPVLSRLLKHAACQLPRATRTTRRKMMRRKAQKKIRSQRTRSQRKQYAAGDSPKWKKSIAEVVSRNGRSRREKGRVGACTHAAASHQPEASALKR